MSFLFGSDEPAPQAPAPAPVPPPPSTSEDAQAARAIAVDSATTETASRGRRSTMVAGMEIAGDAQSEKGMLSAKRRAAARELGQ